MEATAKAPDRDPTLNVRKVGVREARLHVEKARSVQCEARLHVEK